MASAQNKSSEHKMALLKMQKQKEILEQSKSSLQNIVVLQTERIGNLEEKIGIVADERKELCERLNKAERELSAMTKEKIGIVADEQKELYERLNKAERELSAMTNKLAYFSNLKVKFIKFENKWGYVADTFFAEQKKIIHDNMFDGKVGSLYVNPDGKLEYKASESAK
uniref:Chromosome partition protein Smc n=1 Tax=Meloidogyne hapla TaxID=6305 RepID=A0A1I8B5E7_MELHA